MSPDKEKLIKHTKDKECKKQENEIPKIQEKHIKESNGWKYKELKLV